MRQVRLNRFAAFPRIELLVVIAFIDMLASRLLPARSSAKRQALLISGVNNLKQTGRTFHFWSLDNHDRYPRQVAQSAGGALPPGGFRTRADTFRVFQVLANELQTPRILVGASDERGAGTRFVSPDRPTTSTTITSRISRSAITAAAVRSRPILPPITTR